MDPIASDAHPLPWGDGQPYSVKRHGISITNCDSEPVQTPGCVQTHGVVLVLRLADLAILQVSENSQYWLGFSAEALLGQPLSRAIGRQGQTLTRERLSAEPTDGNPVHVTRLDALRDGGPALDVSVHTVDGLVVLEIEAADAAIADQHTDYYELLKKAVTRLRVKTLLDLCQSVTEEVKTLVGFDRVMVYRFHDDGHGEVFAECRTPELTPWIGLHYPAQDIPKPAREIFEKIWIRPVPDVGAELAELVPLANPDTGNALTMTHCALRGPSLMYTEYLQNMKVRAALTLSIRRDGKLWGLIACHHYSGPRAISYQRRAACELFAQVVSLQLRAAEEREQLLYKLRLDGVRQYLVSAAARAGGLSAMSDGTLTLFDALDSGGAAIYHGNKWLRMGSTPSEPELNALSTWLLQRRQSEPSAIYATDCLAQDYPVAEAFADVASGVVAAPLSFSHKSMLFWFRPETMQSITWGGNPNEKPMVPGPHGPRLTPRGSFELFVESVRLRSVPWKPVELESAAKLRLFLMEFVIDQSEELAELNADLARSNADHDEFAYVVGHDLKEPLRGIHKYAHQLLDDATLVNAEQQQKVANLIRLTARMDSLLDSLLHFSRVGRSALDLALVDLGEVLGQALEMVEARRGEQSTDIVIPRPLLPARCDAMCAREVFVNLLSNAIKYSDGPRRRVEVGYLTATEARECIDPARGLAGQVVYYVRDDGIGIASRHHEQVFEMFRRMHGREEYGGGTGAGLTIVKKMIERHRGQVWLESVVGQGSTFFFTLSGADS